MTRKELDEEFRGKILAYSPSAQKPVIYQMVHFLDIFELQKILNHVDDLKLELTLYGIDFLKNHYGYENLARILAESGGIGEYINGEEQILTWLEVKESYIKVRLGKN